MIALAGFLVSTVVVIFFGLLALGVIITLLSALFEEARQSRASRQPYRPREPLKLPEHLMPYSLIARRRKA